MNRLTAALLLLLPPLAVQAQETRQLDDQVTAELVAFYNRPSTIRLSGQTRVPASAEIAGDVAALGGPVVVAGTIHGDLLVINGDLELRPGSRIVGGVVVAGGAVTGPLDGVAGPVVVYPEPIRFRREDERLIALAAGPRSPLSADWSTSFGRVSLMATVGGSYNRVEGLPISFGPRLELGRSNPTVLDARLIYRTQSGLRLHHGEFGHDIRVEQYLGGHQAFRVGAGIHDAVDPIELNGLSDQENSLSTFILHRDYRDHYRRKGWKAYAGYESRTRPLDVGIEYRDEDHGSVRPSTPWSLLENDEPWRPQPQVAEGEISTLRGRLVWDSRNDRQDPSAGWLIRAESEQGLEGELRVMEPAVQLPDGSLVYPSRAVRAEFSNIRLDVRRYLRVGPRSRLALRAVAEGSPDDDPLPPQRQHVLGGEGTLPGFDRFAFDCGARDRQRIDDFAPYYGCDRSVLFQVEGRYALFGSGGPAIGRRLGLDFDLVTNPELVLFFDAGRAWIEEESVGTRDPGAPAFRYDGGVGLRLGRLGLYLAVPLSDGGVGTNFFARLGPRF